MERQDASVSGLRRTIGLIVVPLAAAAVLLFADLDPARPLVTRMAAVAVLMAGWWVTEAIPIPATALLPVALFPLLGIMSGDDVAALYFNHVIFLFVGGFIFALAMQRWNLHRRIALRTILLLGTSPRRVTLGFMVATWFLSMWISNTAATMMVVPMAMAITGQFKETFGEARVSRYATGLLIGIAYAASIGGLATLIGTPPNLAFARILEIVFPEAPEITFAEWFAFALPLSVVFLLIAWMTLSWLFRSDASAFRGQTAVFREEHGRLGPTTYEERIVLVLFLLLVLLWMFRSDVDVGAWTLPGWSRLMPVAGYVDDGTVAIVVALLLFVVPARGGGKRLMDWRTATRLQWGIVILFGGGFALAAGFKDSGLSAWLGQQLSVLGGMPHVVMVLSSCTMLTFLTELTSNTATTQIFLPVLSSLAVETHVHPLLLMIPATLSASCAFMLPVATPPNAIVFGTGAVRMGDMMRAGLLLNLVGILLITLAVYTLGQGLLGIDPATVPAWATGR